MIEYFKYATSGAFTLSSVPYSGFVNVKDGVAYTGKTFTESSRVLESTDTFFANSMLSKLEFDRTTTDIIETNILLPRVMICLTLKILQKMEMHIF